MISIGYNIHRVIFYSIINLLQPINRFSSNWPTMVPLSSALPRASSFPLLSLATPKIFPLVRQRTIDDPFCLSARLPDDFRFYCFLPRFSDLSPPEFSSLPLCPLASGRPISRLSDPNGSIMTVEKAREEDDRTGSRLETHSRRKRGGFSRISHFSTILHRELTATNSVSAFPEFAFSRKIVFAYCVTGSCCFPSIEMSRGPSGSIRRINSPASDESELIDPN